jgi:hypothetical protein
MAISFLKINKINIRKKNIVTDSRGYRDINAEHKI